MRQFFTLEDYLEILGEKGCAKLLIKISGLGPRVSIGSSGLVERKNLVSPIFLKMLVSDSKMKGYFITLPSFEYFAAI